MEKMFRQRRISVPKRTCELVALLAVSSTLFLFLHTRDLSTKLRRMEGHLNDDDPSHPTNREQRERGEKSTNHDRYGGERRLEAHSEEASQVGSEDPQTHSSSEDDPLLPEPRELNNTAKAGMDVVFFNRVPKVGSQTFMELLRRLSVRNEFVFQRDAMQRVETVRLGPADQQLLVDLVASLTPPSAYVKHVCYTNFTRFGVASPIYVNVVRDPVERIISWYYYVRAPWYYVERKRAFPDLPLPDPNWLKKDFETCVLSGDRECRYVEGETHEAIGDHRRQSLFFCGHEPECTPFNSLEALQRAKRVVETQYAVVGVLEDMNATLAALERYVPRFFKGAPDLYWNELDTFNSINKNSFKPPVSEEVKNIVRGNFTREIEFYEFCRQRLYLQLRALRDPNLPKYTSSPVKQKFNRPIRLHPNAL